MVSLNALPCWTARPIASGRTQIGTADSMKLSPDQARSSVWPIVFAIAVAAARRNFVPGSFTPRCVWQPLQLEMLLLIDEALESR